MYGREEFRTESCLPKKWCVHSSLNYPFSRNIFCQNFQKIFLLDGFLDIWFAESTGMVKSTLSLFRLLFRPYLICINTFKPDKFGIRFLKMKKKNQYSLKRIQWFLYASISFYNIVGNSIFSPKFYFFSVCDDLSWFVSAIPRI